MGPMIANRRTPEVQEKYKEIGGGSPILKWTETQGELLCKKLDAVSPSTAPHKPYVAFRYVPPYTEDAFTSIEKYAMALQLLYAINDFCLIFVEMVLNVLLFSHSIRSTAVLLQVPASMLYSNIFLAG